jgi:hypothetical protein
MDEYEKIKIARENLDEIRLEAGRLYRALGDAREYRHLELADAARKASRVQACLREFSDVVERKMEQVRRALETENGSVHH